MKNMENESLPKLNRNNGKNEKVRLIAPKFYRRDERARRNRNAKRRNDGKVLGSGMFTIGLTKWDPSAIYIPRRKKIKGWQRENRKYRKIA